MKVSGVAHTSFTVSDISKSVAFYCDVLGMELVSQSEGSGLVVEAILGMPGAHIKGAFLKSVDHTIELMQYVSPRGKPYDRRTCDTGPSHIAFWVKDIHKAYKALSAKGVNFKSSPQAVELSGKKSWACYLTDPDGITLEFMQIPE